jgi:hypothetical protein
MINETTNVCVEENNWENQQERERERESRTFWTMKEKEDFQKKGDVETETEEMTRDGERMPFGL